MKTQFKYTLVALLLTTSATAQSPQPITYQQPGLFHTPTLTNPVKRFTWNPPTGAYNKIIVDMDLTNTGWSKTPAALHNIFWLVRDGNRDMIGYLNVKGPKTNTIMIRNGIDVPHAQKTKVTHPFNIATNKTYHLKYIYDLTNQKITLTLNANQTALVLFDQPNIKTLTFNPNNQLIMDLGFNNSNPNEPATLGWKYANLKIQLTPHLP